MKPATIATLVILAILLALLASCDDGEERRGGDALPPYIHNHYKPSHHQ